MSGPAAFDRARAHLEATRSLGLDDAAAYAHIGRMVAWLDRRGHLQGWVVSAHASAFAASRAGGSSSVLAQALDGALLDDMMTHEAAAFLDNYYGRPDGYPGDLAAFAGEGSVYALPDRIDGLDERLDARFAAWRSSWDGSRGAPGVASLSLTGPAWVPAWRRAGEVLLPTDRPVALSGHPPGDGERWVWIGLDRGQPSPVGLLVGCRRVHAGCVVRVGARVDIGGARGELVVVSPSAPALPAEPELVDALRDEARAVGLRGGRSPLVFAALTSDPERMVDAVADAATLLDDERRLVLEEPALADRISVVMAALRRG